MITKIGSATVPHKQKFSKQIFVQLGLNDADTLKSSSILIYSNTEQSIYTQGEGMMPYMINIKLNYKSGWNLNEITEPKILGLKPQDLSNRF